jgi:hypothetical protein
MMLKYIGPDEKDGLRHGNVYDCLFCNFDKSYNRYFPDGTRFDDAVILVSTRFPDMCKGQYYRTFREMFENWEEV